MTFDQFFLFSCGFFIGMGVGAVMVALTWQNRLDAEISRHMER